MDGPISLPLIGARISGFSCVNSTSSAFLPRGGEREGSFANCFKTQILNFYINQICQNLRIFIFFPEIGLFRQIGFNMYTKDS